jgi:hypothetical protein
MSRWLVGGGLVVLVCAGATAPAGGQKVAQPPAVTRGRRRLRAGSTWKT